MRAITRSLDHDGSNVQLEDVARGDGMLFVSGRLGFAGRGSARRIPADEAVAFLAQIDHHDQVGGTPGPVAIGALPFSPGAPAELIIPTVIVGRDDRGRTWCTELDGATDEDRALTPRSRPLPAAGAYRISPTRPTEQYLHAVLAAREAVRDHRLTKAVIAREVTIQADRPIDLHAVLLRLRTAFGTSYRYSVDGLLGASPELLIEVDEAVVRSHPLAGTAPRTGDPDTDAALAAALVASTKDQIEHRVVIEMVHDTLLPYVSYLDWQPEPSIVTVANVQHLGSQVEGRLSQPAPDVVELVRALSPTPALGGYPRDQALELIEQVEGFDRGRYGGAVGWVDARGNGAWAVTIRCAELSEDRRRARLVAGGGIVADSDPHAELAETQAKLQAMLSAIVRP